MKYFLKLAGAVATATLLGTPCFAQTTDSNAAIAQAAATPAPQAAATTAATVPEVGSGFAGRTYPRDGDRGRNWGWLGLLGLLGLVGLRHRGKSS